MRQNGAMLALLPLLPFVLFACSPQGPKAKPTTKPLPQKGGIPKVGEKTPKEMKKQLPRPVLVLMKTRITEEQWTFFVDGGLWHLRFDRGLVLDENYAGPSKERLLAARRLASLLRVLAKDRRSAKKREDPGESESLGFRFLLTEAEPPLSFERPEKGVPKGIRRRIEALLSPKASPRVPGGVPPQSRPRTGPGEGSNKGQGTFGLPPWIARAKPYALAMGLDREEAKDVRAFLKKHKLPHARPEKGSFGDGMALRHPWFFWPSRRPARQGEWILEFQGHFLFARVWKNPKRAK